jgi:hypothetical protein
MFAGIQSDFAGTAQRKPSAAPALRWPHSKYLRCRGAKPLIRLNSTTQSFSMN